MEGMARSMNRRIKVALSEAERVDLERRAAATGLPVAVYLRNVGLGHEPASLFDQDAIGALVRLHADQGRLGGLLKQWLTTRRGEGAPAREVRTVLQQIEQLQKQLQAIVQKVVL